MIEDARQSMYELSRTRTSSSECLPVLEIDVLESVLRNYSYPATVFHALQTSTIDQKPRSEELYWDGLEELEDLPRNLVVDNTPAPYIHIENSPEFTYKFETDKGRKFLTPSRVALDNCLQSHATGNEPQSKHESRVRRRGGLFQPVHPDELKSVGLNTGEFEIDPDGKSTTVGNLQDSEQKESKRILHQKSASHEGSFHRPEIPTRQHRHKPVKSMDVNSGRLGPSTGEPDRLTFETPFSETTALPLSVFNKENNSSRMLSLRRGTGSLLARVDENAVMDHKRTMTPSRDLEPSVPAKTTNTIVRSQSDSASHPTIKKREGRGSLRRKHREGEVKEKDAKGHWLHRMTDWWTVSEPSTQALKQHKKEVFKRAGISIDDPHANAKLHVPYGEIPATAIKPSGPGPEPEEVFKKELEQKKKSGKSTRGNSLSTSRASKSSSNPPGVSRQADAIFPFN